MNELKKKRMKAVFKYTWPFYIISALLVVFLLNFIFGLVHATPLYKSLTLFVSGKVEDRNALRKDIMEKYKEKELKLFSCIECEVDNFNYDTKLSVTGYNTADVLILPVSKLDSVNANAFALEMDQNLVNTYYSNYQFYKQEEVNYGVKIDKEKVKKYMTLPEEDCYLVLNGNSQNLGEYSSAKIKERDNALTLVKDWGLNV